MPKYRVELQRQPKKPFGENPFRPGAIYDTHETTIRTWEFEAENEAAVKKYLEEAQAERHPHVTGFELRSITEILEG